MSDNNRNDIVQETANQSNDTITAQSGNFSAKQQFDIYNEQLKDRTTLPDVEQSAQNTLRNVSRRKQSVRLSPMASALLQKRNGVYLPPTHFATPITRKEILNPACTPALRVHLKQTGPAAVPHGAMAEQTISLHRKLHGQWMDKQNEEYGSPMSFTSNPTTSTKAPNPVGDQEAPSVPFFPAMHESLTKNLLKTDDSKEVSSALQRLKTNFVARAPRERIQKRALIIGIEYNTNANAHRNSFAFGQSVEKWYNLVVRDFQFLTKEIRILSDAFKPASGKAGVFEPTYANIKIGLEWLLGEAKKGDHLFLCYSGDVGSKKEVETDPITQVPHCIIPIDYAVHENCVWDHEIQDLIKNLPNGVNFTAFLDCRCSWHLISLPYVYRSSRSKLNGTYEVTRALPTLDSMEQNSTPSFMSVFRKSRAKWHEKERIKNVRRLKYFEDTVKKFENGANVVCFSTTPGRNRRLQWFGSGTSKIGTGEYTDAVEKAFNELLKEGNQLTYRNLMFHIAEMLSPRGESLQLPQLCSSKELDIDQIIAL